MEFFEKEFISSNFDSSFHLLTALVASFQLLFDTILQLGGTCLNLFDISTNIFEVVLFDISWGLDIVFFI